MAWYSSSNVASFLMGVEFPTPRQVDSWRRAGVFGEHHRNLGSGNRDVWTDEELDALKALKRLHDVFAEHDLHFSMKFATTSFDFMLNNPDARRDGFVAFYFGSNPQEGDQ